MSSVAGNVSTKTQFWTISSQNFVFEYFTGLIFQSYYPLKTYGNASSVSHWINLGMVIIAWANAMMVAILPRFAWMNPETSGQILFQVFAKGL